jgi:hypothetical protein
MNTSVHRSIRPLAAAGIAGLLALGLAGCNGIQHPEDFPLNGPTPAATSNPQEVSANDLGHSWNLEVDHGTISCEENSKGDPVLRFTAPDGTDYALNSVDENSELPPIDDISDGSIGTLRTFAFTVCDA